MTNKQFGTNLARLRTAHGLTQAQLATRSGLHRTFISSVEKGERNITLETITKLEHALKISAGEFFSQNAREFEVTTRPTDVSFVKIGGTWDMVSTKDGLRGTGNIDDDVLAEIETSCGFDENKIREALDTAFAQTEPIQKDIASHLFWVKDLSNLIKGKFFPIFSADGSNLRPAIFSSIIAYLLNAAAKNPLRQIIVGAGTDTTDMLMPFLDAFLFDSKTLPMLVSGANRSHRETHSDAPQNFHDLALATHLALLPGAYYVFNRTIYKGGDIVKVDPNEDPSTLEGMLTFFAPQRTQTKIGYLQTQEIKKRVSAPTTYSSREIFDALEQVATVDLGNNNPMHHEIAKILDPRFGGIVIVAHALGNAPGPIRRAALEAAKNGKLVLNISRCLIGNTTDRYYVSLSSINRRELSGSKQKILEGGKLNHGAAKALIVRALLEKRGQEETQQLIDSFCERTF